MPHYLASVTVCFNCGRSIRNNEPIGYTIAIGINADRILDAALLAHDIALSKYDELPHIVDRFELNSISKEDLEPEVLQQIKDIDKKGVYYVSGLAFFS